MRIVSADALISAMLERIRLAEMCQAGERLSGFIAGIEECIHITRDIMPVDAPTVGWISVKERLPEEDGEYLIGWANSDEMYLSCFTRDCFGMSFGLRDEEQEHRPAWYYIDDEWGEVEWDNVEYWMEKPAPPETKGEENE